MKKRIITISVLVISMIFSQGMIAQTMNPTKETDGLKEKIQAMNDKLARANVAGDLETVASLYAEDIIYMPNYAPMIRGKENLLAYEKKMAESGAKITSMSLTTLEVTDMGEKVYEVGTYAISMVMTGMPVPIADQGKYVSIYRKLKDGSLEMVVDIWNTDVNPWEGQMGKGKMKSE